jgi:hypothetical protein
MSGMPTTRHANAAFSAVDNSGWNMDDGAFPYSVRDSVERHRPLPFEHVVKLGACGWKIETPLPIPPNGRGKTARSQEDSRP